MDCGGQGGPGVQGESRHRGPVFLNRLYDLSQSGAPTFPLGVNAAHPAILIAAKILSVNSEWAFRRLVATQGFPQDSAALEMRALKGQLARSCQEPFLPSRF